MSGRLDLGRLRGVAEAADGRDSWRVDEEGWITDDVLSPFLAICGGGPRDSIEEHAVANVSNYGQGIEQCEADARFIATFDPPTVLALIEALVEAKGLLLSLTGGGMDPMERAERLRLWFDRIRGSVDE